MAGRSTLHLVPSTLSVYSDPCLLEQCLSEPPEIRPSQSDALLSEPKGSEEIRAVQNDRS
jgi:hypothetical protein